MLVTLTYLSLISSKISYKQFLTLLLVWNCFRGHKLLFLVFICFYWILWVILYLKCCFPWLSGESVQFSHWVVSNTLATWCEEQTYWKTTLMLGKIEGKRRGWQRMIWLTGIIDSMGMSLSKLQEMVKSGKPGVLQSMGSQRVGHNWGTEQHKPRA